MNVQISVVIPMYNGSQSIRKCLENLSRQTFTGTYEVIIVDDASPDGSAKEVKKMVEALENAQIFQIVECTENARAGAARNIGVKQAKGEYILFIDQDDYPDVRMLEKLWELTKEAKIDCVSCNIGDKGGVPYHRVYLGYKEELTANERIALMKGHGYVFAMLIRKSIIEKEHLYFPEKLMFEDCLYNFGIFASIQSFCNTKEELYFRETDENSQTANLTKKKLADRIAATKWYFQNFKDNKMVQNFEKQLKQEAVWYIYLSCVWWMLTDKALYDEAMIQQSIIDAKKLQIDWSETLRNEKRFKKVRLTLLKNIYFHPNSYKIIAFFLTTMIGCKKMLKRK